MNLSNIRSSKIFPLKILLLLIAAILVQSCEDNPNDLGLIFVPASDTTMTRFLDSQADTMNIAQTNYKKYINTSLSTKILVGNYQNYQSKFMLKFKDISPDYDSSTVTSAILTLRYSDYFFENETGQTSFNAYRMNADYNYSTVTFDSVPSSSYGTISMGNYSGSPVDTQKVEVPLNNQLIKDWLEYAADTSYSNKNFGIIFVPDAGSNVIKGFYSSNNDLAFIPYVTVVYTKNNATDTLTLITSDFVTLSDAPTTIIPPDRFVLQNGIAYRDRLNFDLSKLPNNVIINNVTLRLTLDNSASFISSTTDKRIIVGMVVDSLNQTDSLFAEAFQTDSSTYSISTITFNSIFQRWNSGVLPNLGISLKNYFELQNLDRFVFYSPNAADISKRPRLQITYTPRQ